MTLSTFTATIALEDDQGNTYNADEVLTAIEYIVHYVTQNPGDASLFSITQGEGIDTDTRGRGDGEPIVIVQGFVPTSRAHALMSDLAHYAGDTLNQRGIGWFTSTSSYVTTPYGAQL